MTGTIAFTCSICEEVSTRICDCCTKDTCDNHLCEKCLCCSDCCECEIPLDEPVHASRPPDHGNTHAAHFQPDPDPKPEPPHPDPVPEDEPGPGLNHPPADETPEE